MRAGKYLVIRPSQGVKLVTTIKFSYKDAKGEVTQRELVQFSENSIYIQGRSAADSFPKTFRKDRIVEVYVGAELLLNDAAPPAPTLKQKPSPAAIAVSATNSHPPQPKVPPGGISQILFTGFAAAYRAELEQKALDSGLNVMRTPGKSLTFLCYGDNAGPTKVAKAQQAGAFIIDAEQFLSLITTGEMP